MIHVHSYTVNIGVLGRLVCQCFLHPYRNGHHGKYLETLIQCN